MIISTMASSSSSSLLVRLSVLIAFSMVVSATCAVAASVSFSEYYDVLYGGDRVSFQGHQARIALDKYSGSGFRSQKNYSSGSFSMKMKLPESKSTALLTTFYLISREGYGGGEANHDEVDMEFLGSNNTMPHVLHTNVFAADSGGREERFNLWFDPTADFHTYQILWNQHQIGFFVDDVPIRVFKNRTNLGVNFPTGKMHVEGTIWNGSWASTTGQPIDISEAPFYAYYQTTGIDGCEFQSSNVQRCYDEGSGYWWNDQQYWQLSRDQELKYKDTRNKYLTYDYCSHSGSSLHPECKIED